MKNPVPAIWPRGKEMPPQQDTVEKERRYRQERLAAACRIFGRLGYDMGGAGHITARDPEHEDRFWVNPYTIPFAHVRVSDLIQVDHDGNIVAGEGRLNRAAFAIHARLHAARPDVVAAAHAHSFYGKVWSTTGRLLDPITQDSCAFFEDHAIFGDFSGVVYAQSEGDRIAEALGPRKALILQNHGLLTVGATIEAAIWRYIGLENAAQAQITAESIGTPTRIADEIARHTSRQVGSEISGIYGFKPYWDQVVRDEPDFLN